MADRPILFSAPMVRAILREIAAHGTGKTQTRRIPPIVKGLTFADLEREGLREHDAYQAARHQVQEPRFQTGDRLWVREAWRVGRGYDGVSIKDIAPWPRIWWDADDARDNCDAIGLRLRPSIHMPRWASRLTLHVTDVRVQRLQEISEADARAEGVERDSDGWRDYLMPETQCCGNASESFGTLWDSLNAERAPWASNPWVVAVTFRPELGNIDRVTA